jgi:hypothetical protein
VYGAQAKAADAESRAAEAESQALLLGRSLREAESAVVDWQVRARQAEDARQELNQLVGGSEAAVKQVSVSGSTWAPKCEAWRSTPRVRSLTASCTGAALTTQVQSDLAHMQLAHSSERVQAAAAQQQLERALADAQAAQGEAEAQLCDTERTLADMRGALDSQERLLLVLREQVAAGGAAAARANDLEGRVQALQASLAEAQQTVAALRSRVAAADGQAQSTVSSLLTELADKSSQLVDAERRFSQLEALMQRIASRTGQGGVEAVLAAEGLRAINGGSGEWGGGGGGGRSSALRNSWAGAAGGWR